MQVHHILMLAIVFASTNPVTATTDLDQKKITIGKLDASEVGGEFEPTNKFLRKHDMYAAKEQVDNLSDEERATNLANLAKIDSKKIDDLAKLAIDLHKIDDAKKFFNVVVLKKLGAEKVDGKNHDISQAFANLFAGWRKNKVDWKAAQVKIKSAHLKDDASTGVSTLYKIFLSKVE